MNQPTTPFKLHAPGLSPDSAVTPSADLPAEVAGKPASYFWKDMIHTGNYVHPEAGFSLAVDRDRLQRWADTGKQLLAAGVAIPINCDHSDAARDVVGYIKEFKLDGDQLLGLCQFIGEDAALTAARNFVSVGIDPEFTDGQARKWGESIVHLALTPVPVVPGQNQFVQATGEQEPVTVEDDDDDDASLPCTAEQFQTLCELIGEDLQAEDCVASIIEQLQSKQNSAADLAAKAQTELAAARNEIMQLSARMPPVVPAEVQAAIAETASAKLDLAVDRGILSPSVRDRLVSLLVPGPGGKASVLSLSRAANLAGDQCLALAVADVLLDNEPVSLGERTGLQAMSRLVPGEESSPIDQLRQYMTKIASVSG
jgi:hypothetical protein